MSVAGSEHVGQGSMSGGGADHYYHKSFRLCILGDKESNKSDFVTEALSNAGRVSIISGKGCSPDSDGWRASTCLLCPEGSEDVVRMTLMECSHDYSRYSTQIDSLISSSALTAVVVTVSAAAMDRMLTSTTGWLERILACSTEGRPQVVALLLLYRGNDSSVGDPSAIADSLYQVLESMLPGSPILTCDLYDSRSALQALQSLYHVADAHARCKDI